MLEKELAALRDLGITEGEWAVFAGSALALHGLKSTTDLDILVTSAELARIKGPCSNDVDNFSRILIPPPLNPLWSGIHLTPPQSECCVG